MMHTCKYKAVRLGWLVMSHNGEGLAHVRIKYPNHIFFVFVKIDSVENSYFLPSPFFFSN